MIREIRNALSRFGLAGTQLNSFFPGHLIEIAIVKDENDQARIRPLLPVFRNRDHHIDAVHLHDTIAHAGNHGAIRIGHLSRERVRRSRAQ
jgi:hypothetical protein